MRLQARSDRGLVRANNQDNFVILKQNEITLSVVCDGLGGHQGGEVASQLAVKTMKSHFKDLPDFSSLEEIAAWLKHVVVLANNVILEKAQQLDLLGMGTTLVAYFTHPLGNLLVNVGDSRCYGIKDNQLILLSEDHSYVNELVKSGKLSDQDAAKHPYRNMLTNALGINQTITIDTQPISGFELILLCSDGLSSYVDHSIIESIVTSKAALLTKTKQLIDQANQVGGLDNITVILIDHQHGVI